MFKTVVITLPSFFEGEAERITELLLTGKADLVHIRKPASKREDVERLLQAIPRELHPRLTLHDHFELAQRYDIGGLHLNSRTSEGCGEYVLYLRHNNGAVPHTGGVACGSTPGYACYAPSGLTLATCKPTKPSGLAAPQITPKGLHMRSRGLSEAEPPEQGASYISAEGTAHNCLRRLSKSCHSLAEVAQEKGRYDYVSLSPIFDSISKQGYLSAFTPEQIAQAKKEGIIDERVFALGGVRFSMLSMVREMGFGGAMILGDAWRDLI